MLFLGAYAANYFWVGAFGCEYNHTIIEFVLPCAIFSHDFKIVLPCVSG